MRHLPLTRRILVCVGLGAVVALAGLLVPRYLPQGSSKGSNMPFEGRVAKRHLEYRFSLQNSGSQVMEKANSGPMAR